MEFDLSPEHRLVRDTIRCFAEKEIYPVARRLDEQEEFSSELINQMGTIGFWGILFPEKY
jgi:short-chain 2-methylacyl-CoA dehydrogenase